MQPQGKRQVIISFRPEHLLGWGVTIAACVIPVVLWLRIHPLATIQGYTGIMLSLGRVTGLVGFVMYSLNLVYSTRWRFLERFFGGLNRVYIAHHLLGGLALILLSFHPVFLALRYIFTSFKQAALLMLPNGLTPLSALFDPSAESHALVLEQWAIFFGLIAFWAMVVLLLVTFFIKLPYRIWLLSHKFLGAAFFFAGLHVLFITSDTTTHPELMAYMLGATGLGLYAFAYKTLFGPIIIKRQPYLVNLVKSLPGSVYQITLTPQQKALSFHPGQFVFVRFLGAQKTGISQEWHPFSISSGPDDTNLQLSVKALGDYTSKLGALPVGTKAQVEGAYGRFSFVHYRNPLQVWVAGGIGVTPFLSMARRLPQIDYRIDLYYSVKTASELIDADVLEQIASQTGGRFRVIQFVSDQQNGAFLDANFIEKTTGPLSKFEVYVCGPPPMMAAMRRQFRGKGVPNARIHTEEFAMS